MVQGLLRRSIPALVAATMAAVVVPGGGRSLRRRRPLIGLSLGLIPYPTPGVVLIGVSVRAAHGAFLLVAWFWAGYPVQPLRMGLIE